MAGAVRIARYRARLAAADDGQRFYSASFDRDPWATAREVLAWRDGLCAAGWQGNDVPEEGTRLETLAAIETAGQPVLGPSPGERLTAVIILLATARDRLPARWRHLVGLLESGGTAIDMASTPIEDGTGDLAMVRRALAHGRIDRTLAGDGSFVVIEADDEIQAADARRHHEVPVVGRFGDQRVAGRIDLLLEDADSFIIIDHKSFPGGMDQWPSKALEYAPQLALYGQMVERATGKKVRQCLVHMPVVGAIMDVIARDGAISKES